MRSTADVFSDHLLIRAAGHENIERDVRQNYSRDCVIITNFGTFHGHDGVKRCAAILERDVPPTNYIYTLRLVHGEIAYLEWKVEDYVEDGSDTFHIKDGKILVQTIRYSVRN